MINFITKKLNKRYRLPLENVSFVWAIYLMKNPRVRGMIYISRNGNNSIPFGLYRRGHQDYKDDFVLDISRHFNDGGIGSYLGISIDFHTKKHMRFALDDFTHPRWSVIPTYYCIGWRSKRKILRDFEIFKRKYKKKKSSEGFSLEEAILHLLNGKTISNGDICIYGNFKGNEFLVPRRISCQDGALHTLKLTPTDFVENTWRVHHTSYKNIK